MEFGGGYNSENSKILSKGLIIIIHVFNCKHSGRKFQLNSNKRYQFLKWWYIFSFRHFTHTSSNRSATITPTCPCSQFNHGTSISFWGSYIKIWPSISTNLSIFATNPSTDVFGWSIPGVCNVRFEVQLWRAVATA